MHLLRKLLSQGSLLLLCAMHLSGLDAGSPIVGDATIAFDTFRSLPDGSWVDNTGAFIGLNAGAPLPLLFRGGLGIQVGGSYGLYDWTGRGSAVAGSDKSMQQQGFITVALFKRGCCCDGLNFGLAYDWMVNDNFGVFALNLSISQVRYQASYLFRARDEFGFWGTAHTNTSRKTTMAIPVAFRAINQINLFWRHSFRNCAEIEIWGGVPFGRGLMFSTPGQFILGANFEAPIAACWAIHGHAAYMHPHSAPGPVESENSASNVCIGIRYLFGRSKERACSFRPYLPLANNSNFLADTSVNY
jgi:Family of unknown function (DUF6666)